MQDARQMINSRKQVQHHQLGSPPQIAHPHPAAGQHHLMNHMSQMQIHTGPGSLGGGGVGRQFPPTGLQMGAPGVRGGPLPSKPLDARDRLSLKRGIGASQSQMAMTAPFKITKTIQVRTGRRVLVWDWCWSRHNVVSFKMYFISPIRDVGVSQQKVADNSNN